MLGVQNPVFINLLEHPFFISERIQRIIQASAASARLVEEGLRRSEFGFIDFRDSLAKRQASGSDNSMA
jgi:hypothetical protein